MRDSKEERFIQINTVVYTLYERRVRDYCSFYMFDDCAAEQDKPAPPLLCAAAAQPVRQAENQCLQEEKTDVSGTV